jgi:predicted nucleotidyltransferase
MTSDKKNIENQVIEPQLAEYQLINELGLVNNKMPELIRICKSHNVQKLELFGSAVKGPFSSKSDVDLLVQFHSSGGLF